MSDNNKFEGQDGYMEKISRLLFTAPEEDTTPEEETVELDIPEEWLDDDDVLDDELSFDEDITAPMPPIFIASQDEKDEKAEDDDDLDEEKLPGDEDFMSPEDEELFCRLQALRLRLSQEKGVPPFIILNDSTLVAIAKARPATDEEMLALPGIGEKKLEDYGQVFLAEVSSITNLAAEDDEDIEDEALALIDADDIVDDAVDTNDEEMAEALADDEKQAEDDALMRDAEEELGEELSRAIEDSDGNDMPCELVSGAAAAVNMGINPEADIDAEQASELRSRSTEMVIDKMFAEEKEEEPALMATGVGDSDHIAYAKIPAIYDLRDEEIQLGDIMAYRNDWSSIGPVIGIGDQCFFTLASTTKTDSYGETDKVLWNLYDSRGNRRPFYHYVPDSFERIIEKVYDPTYDIEDLLGRFRTEVHKVRADLVEDEGDLHEGFDPRC